MRTALLALLMLALLLAPNADTTVTLAQGVWVPLSGLENTTLISVAPDTPNVLYAAGVPDSYRSVNGGVRWTRLSTPTGATALNNMVVDPLDWRTVYATNPDYSAPYLFRSADGGQTWHTVYAGRVSAIAVSSQPAHRVTIAADGDAAPGAYRVLQSDDSGGTWREIWSTLSYQGMQTPSVIELTPFGDTVIATVSAYHGGSLFRLNDHVDDWRTVPGIGPQTQVLWPAPYRVVAGSPNTLYVAWTAAGPSTLAALRKTADSGLTWHDITPPLNGQTGEQVGPDLHTPSLTAIAADPTQPTRLFAAAHWDTAATGRPAALATAVIFSSDGGATWMPLGDPLPVGSINTLAYSATNRTLFAATTRGLWQYTLSSDTVPPEVAAWFRRYYDAHDGWRLLGRPLRASEVYHTYPVQVFEKGRIEDHSAEERDPNWRIMYGLLVDEIIQSGLPLPVGGNTSTLTYVGLGRAAAEDLRVPPPAGLLRGVRVLPNGSVFIPYDAHLDAAPGHTVPPVFWTYLNRADLFPGGWLHDIGLPMTEPLTAVVDKGDVQGRMITVQAFQRTVLTYDPLNPPAWQVERANVGRDFLMAFPAD